MGVSIRVGYLWWTRSNIEFYCMISDAVSDERRHDMVVARWARGEGFEACLLT